MRLSQFAIHEGGCSKRHLKSAVICLTVSLSKGVVSSPRLHLMRGLASALSAFTRRGPLTLEPRLDSLDSKS
eukprot:5738699-Prymnesium_polylepis.1